MLNIAEPVPPPESVPSDSGIPAIEFQRIWTEFHLIPELDGIPTDSESLGIRLNSGIRPNSGEFQPIPEFRTALTLMYTAVLNE